MAAQITEVRHADENHQVLTIVGGPGAHRREPCGGCPWRKDQVGTFPAEAFRHSARTAHDMAVHTFACHESGAAKPTACAGFMLRGAEHNLAVRLKRRHGACEDVHDGGHALHANYRAMAIANGVPPNDPALAACRD